MLKMLPSRPIHWAIGTDFTPGFDEKSEIMIKIDISEKDGRRDYGKLIPWLISSTGAHASKPLSREEATAIWGSRQKYVILLNIDKAETNYVSYLAMLLSSLMTRSMRRKLEWQAKCMYLSNFNARRADLSNKVD